jgi:flavin-dependent dehydrogenase
MEMAFGYRAPLPASFEAPTVVSFLPGWDGYAWAFPRPDHLSFGIATSQVSFDHEELDSLLWDFLIRYYEGRLGKPPLRELTSDELERGKEKFNDSIERYAARIPKLREDTLAHRRTGSSAWALLGDAAGFADAVTGEGIYYALRSAELFASAYIEGCPESYEFRWRKDFGRDLARASKMRKRFYGNFVGDRFTDRMIQLSLRHPGIRQTLMDLVVGDLGYVNLKRKLVCRFLLPLAY